MGTQVVKGLIQNFVDESLAISIQIVQKPSFVTIGTTGIKENLMHDSNQYISIL